MTDPAQGLRDSKPSGEFFIRIDSDRRIPDRMETGLGRRSPRFLKPARALSCLTLWIFFSAARATEQPQKFPFDDFLLAPVRVHLLSASNAPNVHTTLKETDLTRILGKVNGIWSQAGITFHLESLVREEAENQQLNPVLGTPNDLRQLLALRPGATRATNLFHLYYVKRFTANGVYLGEAMFVKDTASLREVPGGIDEPIPRVSSHELGHALTLMHHTNDFHLMARGTTGTNFDAAEITQARAAAEKLPWVRKAPEVWKQAEELRRSKRQSEAKKLYRQIATLPLDDRRVRAALKRTAGAE
jgi:hypothetical protein